MRKNIKSRIIHELSKEKKGLTNAEILNKMNNEKLTRHHLKYHLNGMVNTKIIEKSGTKYLLLRKSFIIKGSAVLEFKDKLIFLDCPYFGNECKICNDNPRNKGQKCLFIDDLPDFLKELFLQEDG